MTSGERLEMKLELDPDGNPISGAIHDRRGRAHEFHGWTQLVAAIDRARSIERGATGSDQAPEAPEDK